MLKTLGIDLHTHVIDWEEFRDLQISFLKASTPDGEVPTDHAIFALLYEMAASHGVRYVITGTNVATEAVLPEKWGYGYFDWRYVKDVHRRFGTKRLKTYPHFSLPRLFYYVFVRRIRMVSVLNYIDYDKAQAMQLLQDKLGWVYYSGKHYESIYTRFYQAYVLPASSAHRQAQGALLEFDPLGSNDARSGTRRDGEPVYPEQALLDDRNYAIKKLESIERAFRCDHRRTEQDVPQLSDEPRHLRARQANGQRRPRVDRMKPLRVLYLHMIGPFGGASRSLFEAVGAFPGGAVSRSSSLSAAA